MIGAVIAWLQQAEAAQWAVAIGDSVWLPIVVAVVLAAGGPLVFLPSQSLVLVATVIVMAHGPDVLALAVLAAAVWAGGMAGDTLTFGIARRGRLVGAVFDRASRLARLRDWVEQQPPGGRGQRWRSPGWCRSAGSRRRSPAPTPRSIWSASCVWQPPRGRVDAVHDGHRLGRRHLGA